MSQQASIWSRFMAAALANPYVCDENESIDAVTERAAKVADCALAEYNKRMESLSKLEAELAEAWRLIEVRNAQVDIGTRTLMVARDLLEAWRRDHKNDNVDSHWIHELEKLERHLHLVGHTFTTVPDGIDPADPKLHRGAR